MRAKFKCISVTKSNHWVSTEKFLYTAELSPVVQGSEENKKFFEYTPSGSIKLGSFTEEHFEVGKEYYIDFSEAK